VNLSCIREIFQTDPCASSRSNTNGIRSAASKGLFEWLPKQKADVLCIQETKAQLADIEKLPDFFPKGWTARFNSAKKKGYSGVAIYSKQEPDAVLDSLGVPEFDDEGRYLEFRFGNLSVVSLYLPSGSAGPERQASKDRFLEFFLAVLGPVAPKRARVRGVRRLEHRAHRARPEELEIQSEELGLPAA
jgi:exodeoxyribonuclease III